MQASVRPVVRLCWTLCGPLAAVASCKSATVVEPAKECPEPCCGGASLNVDCALHPNIHCIEDADLCSARSYGCADGSYFLNEPTELPTSCAGDEAGTLVFDDAGPGGPQDAADASDVDSTVDGGD